VDNLEVGAPLLRDAGLPATVFISASTIGDRSGFWWDRLSTHMLGGDLPHRHLRIDVAGTALVMDVGTRAARDRAHRFLHARLRLLPPDAVDRALRDLATAIESDRRVPESALPMTEDEVRALAAEQLISIGGHAATHRALPALEEAGQREELMKGKRRLEEIVGKPVRFLAYPYGEYDAITLRIAREVFDLAVTTNEGDAAASDALQLPRYTVRNWPAHQFRAWLKSWLEG
jgi:peptidoglycan/xylan/chitin deacetylase (PgdA/CDA1 family)